MSNHTIHEVETDVLKLAVNAHMIITTPGNFRPAEHMCFGVADFPPEKHTPAHIHLYEKDDYE